MKENDILYLVDTHIGKVIKSKIKSIIFNQTFTLGHYDIFRFNKIRGYAFRNDMIINPDDKRYYESHSRFRNTKKTYLIFSEPDMAQKALIDYVLPRIIESHQKASNRLIDEYNKAIKKAEELDELLQKNKDKFEKKCNALKKKFV